MKNYLPAILTGILLIKGAVALTADVAIIEFREGSTIVDHYVANQLDFAYKVLPLNAEVELEVVSDHDVSLHYNRSTLLSRQRCQSIGQYFQSQGLTVDHINVNTYRKRMYVETISFHTFQEFGAALIFKVKLSRAKPAPLKFTHSGANPFDDFCIIRTINGAIESQVYHNKGVMLSIPAFAFESISGNSVDLNSIDIKPAKHNCVTKKKQK